ncbi:hypothetical protein AB2N04_14705 [Nitratireductor sp. GISD-1A_MAKvit]|uniref:hypothetical protein n=1 Tax=Nitratireductor sp. GISD-1A_MAKvit TaxID=3234198 RepID=UPI00346674D9
MAALIVFLGAVQILGGVLAYLDAVSAIHQILGAVMYGMGVLSLAMGLILSRLTEIKDISEKHLRRVITQSSEKAESAQAPR